MFVLNSIAMFSNYVATKGDLETIEIALEHVLHPKMKFVFSDFSRIAKTLIVSYDSKFIYIWQINPIKLAFKVPHNLTILDEWQYAWKVGFFDQKIKESLPKEIRDISNFETPKISGGLFTPFVKLQKKFKGEKNNPYITKESYLATIIHEFGHIYWNSYKLWWPSSKRENLRYLNLAVNLYSSRQKQKIPKGFSFRLPSPAYLGEVFAFCTEYYASGIFWKDHRRNINIFINNRLNNLIILEKQINLDRENSVIEPNTSTHDFASILGKIILTKYPTNWPEILLKPSFVY